MTSPRIVLTGVTGFLGSHLLNSLVTREVDLCLVTRAASVRNDGHSTASEFVSTEDRNWMEVVRDFHPTCVIHTATRFQVSHDRSDISPMITANVEVGTVLLDIAHECGSRFVTTSSAWQHYQGLPGLPVNLYAATKQAFDVIANFYRGEGLDLRRLTLFDVYGPKDTRRKLVPLLLEAARTGVPMQATSGRQLIDLTYVDDVVRAVLMIALDSATIEASDAVLKSGPVSVRQVAEVLEWVIGQPVPVNWGATLDRPREMREDWGLEPVLPHWKPEVPLAEGLSRIWEVEQSRD